MQNPADAIDFDKAGGVIAAIAQDHQTGQVLMVAWMNREALEETIRTGRACYYSRSRNKLWRKGEESGNHQAVHEIRIDCDADAVLLAVEQTGDGVACHTGHVRCFYQRLEDGRWRETEPRKIDPAKYGAEYGHHSKGNG